MLNFMFHNPTKAVFGKGQLQQLDTLVPRDARVLVTYGGGSARRSGLLDRVRAGLSASGRAVFEFGGIEANPRFSTLMQAVELARRENVDFLLAVGGGSVMDGTKFIAAAAGEHDLAGREEELMHFGFAPVPIRAALPLGTVVTLPATGSEMNGFAVISHGEDKLPVFHTKLYPVFSILDPELTFTLPAEQVANGIVDTFVHVVEQYLTYPVGGRLQDRMAEGILQTLIEVGPATLADPTDYEARANLVWCATMALTGVISAGVPQDWATHMIGHEVTALHGVAHARSLAAVLPGLLRMRRGEKRAKLLQFAQRVWGVSQGTEEERIEQGIRRTEAFFASLGVGTRLGDIGVQPSDLDRIVESLERHGMTALSERGDVTPSVSRKILEASL